ncbi:MAG: hypothetical protein ABFS42_06205 [Candidatus Krumholzibacteriota bacterium]
MSEKRGCFKTGLFGCLGIMVILIVLVGGTALVAWNRAGDVHIEDAVLTSDAAGAPTEVKGTKVTEVPAGIGRVVLDLAQGEFEIHPDQPGRSVRVEASYDSEVYLLEDYYESLPDSSWVYGVRSRRTISGLHALFRQMMSEGHSPKIDVYLPTDTPIELQVLVKEGGFEAELGGLWITSADFRYNKGGFSLSFDEPLREPMDRMSIRGSMGGFEAYRLGNASPGSLDVKCRMGGADLDLRGTWARDADIRLDVAMGGISVRVPDDVRVIGPESTGRDLKADEEEVPLPVLRFSVKEKMGEIEFD